MVTPHVSKDLLIDRTSGLVHVTLNRPAALNALSIEMIDGLLPVLQSPETVLVSGAGDKAFCSGGDMKAIWQALKNGASAEKATEYFRHEYGVNAALFARTGAYVSYLNGIVMGGGYGVSAHGSHLVACEATAFAMPEVKIGFFPDVGAAYHLARAPYELGTWLALTGNTVSGGDMMFAGLAHAYVPLEAFEAFKAGLPDGVEAALEKTARIPPAGTVLQAHYELIARCFAGDSVEAIIEALKVDGRPFALQTAADIGMRSPLSLKITLRHIRAAKTDDFGAVIARDLLLAGKFMENPDLIEGVRAALIDKDRRPSWNPASLAGVTPELLALYFGPGGD